MVTQGGPICAAHPVVTPLAAGFSVGPAGLNEVSLAQFIRLVSEPRVWAWTAQTCYARTAHGRHCAPTCRVGGGAEAEQLLARVAAPSAFSVTSLRSTLVYGPGNGGSILRLMRLIETGLPLPFASGRNRRTVTSVHNPVSAIISVLDRTGPPETFVVCDAESLSRPARLIFPSDGLRETGAWFRSGRECTPLSS